MQQLGAVIRAHGEEELTALRRDREQVERTRKIFARYGIKPWQQGFSGAMNVLFDQRERLLDPMAELRARLEVAQEALQESGQLPPEERARLEATVRWCDRGMAGVSEVVRHHIERSIFLGKIVEAEAMDVFSLEHMLALADLRRGLGHALEQLPEKVLASAPGG